MLNYIFLSAFFKTSLSLSSSSVLGPTSSNAGMGWWHTRSCKGKELNIPELSSFVSSSVLQTHSLRFLFLHEPSMCSAFLPRDGPQQILRTFTFAQVSDVWESSQGYPTGCHPSELWGITMWVAHIDYTTGAQLAPLILGRDLLHTGQRKPNVKENGRFTASAHLCSTCAGI